MKHKDIAELETISHGTSRNSVCDSLSELFHIFGDSTRIRILMSLFENDMCVCAIATLLKMQQSAISHQLRILKQSGLIGSRREGRTVYYFICDDHVRTIINEGMEHITK